MKYYPYSKVKTEHLLTLLLTARFVGFVGYLSIVVSLGLLVFSIFAGPQSIIGDPNSPVVSMSTPGYRSAVWALSIASFLIGLVCMILSGLCAAIVSFEHKYTKD